MKEKFAEGEDWFHGAMTSTDPDPVVRSAVEKYWNNRLAVAVKVDKRIKELQREMYTSNINQLRTFDESNELNFASELLTLYINLAVPSAAANDDVVRSLLYGRQAIPNSNVVRFPIRQCNAESEERPRRRAN